MPSPIELNIGHLPSPGRRRGPDDGADAAPLRIVVLGDFSGRPGTERGPLADRRPLRVDIDNFDTVFARLAPQTEIAGLRDKRGAALRLVLGTMDEFSADAVLARLPAQVPEPSLPALEHGTDDEDAAATMRRLLGGSVAAGAPAHAQPKSDDLVDRFIRQLAGAAPVAPQPVAAPAASNDVAAALLRQVLRDPAWRHLECAWRAVDRFVRGLDMADAGVRLELLDCRADELLADLGAAAGEPARNALAAVLKGDGRGCGLLVSLEEFGAGLAELSLLGGLASLAAAQGAVLLAGAAPALAAVACSDASQAPASNEARAWRALRGSALAVHVGLTFPRLLARLPYGPRDEPVAAFAFDELADAAGASVHDGLLWRSAALDAALLLAQGYAAEGAAGVESPVLIDDLPAFVDRSGDEPRLQAVAEAYLGERDAAALQAAGLITLQSDRRVPAARIGAWQSIADGGAPLAGNWLAR